VSIVGGTAPARKRVTHTFLIQAKSTGKLPACAILAWPDGAGFDMRSWAAVPFVKRPTQTHGSGG
jgi:hypothetical protein